MIRKTRLGYDYGIKVRYNPSKNVSHLRVSDFKIPFPANEADYSPGASVLRIHMIFTGIRTLAIYQAYDRFTRIEIV